MEDQEKSIKRNLLATSMASPFAGMIAKFVMHPVDTIKSKVQVNRMEMKSVADYRPGVVLNLSNTLIIQSNKPTKTKVLQASFEESLFLSSALPSLLLFI